MPTTRPRRPLARLLAARLSALVALATFVVAGCGAGTASVVTSGAGAATSGAAHVTSSCRGFPQDFSATGRRLRAGDRPTAVLRCVEETRLVPGRGEWVVRTAGRAAGTALAAYVAALRLPDAAPPATGTACAAYADQHWRMLEIGGRPVVVAAPVDSCSHVRPEVTAAQARLAWVDGPPVLVRQVRGQALVDAGCEGLIKDLTAMLTDLPPGRGAPDVTLSGGVRACRYRSEPQGVGRAVGGGPLDAATADRVRALVAGARPAAACSERHSRFAWVQGTPGGYLEVELDGCRRLVDGRTRLFQAPPELVRLLSR